MPSKDIFGFDAEYRGVGLITAKDMVLKIEGRSTEGTQGDYLVQNVAISYQQPIQIIRELSTGNAYYHALPPQGTISFGRIVGKGPITKLLGPPGQGIWKAPQAGEGDEKREISLTRIGGQQPAYRMYGCIAENFSGSTDANSSFVQENIVVRFGMLNIES